MDRIFERLDLELCTLTIYRSLMSKPALASFQRLCRAASVNDFFKASEQYSRICSHLIESGTMEIGRHLFELMKHEDTAFSKAVAQGIATSELDAAARRDFDILSSIANLSCGDIKRELMGMADGRNTDVFSSMPEWETGPPMDYDELVSSITKNGTGIFAKYTAFIFTDGKLMPIVSPDSIRYEELIGYECQRAAVVENTRALLDGKRVNNVLLYGDSGTGKSATVKSLLSIKDFDRLRIIQVEKNSLSRLPELIEDIGYRVQKFILFIDDLSFEDGDRDFSSLKIVLEGSIQAHPENIVLYATSNRRQLVKRRFSDSDEINENETVQEKTSLADRFGISIPFFELKRVEYLDMAERLARRAGSNADSETLRKEALKWEIERSSRTPRTAQQFADFMTSVYT